MSAEEHFGVLKNENAHSELQIWKNDSRHSFLGVRRFFSGLVA